MSTKFTAEQRKEMLLAVHKREGRWDQLDPDTEVQSIGDDIGLSEDKSYELFKSNYLLDAGCVLPQASLSFTGNYYTWMKLCALK